MGYAYLLLFLLMEAVPSTAAPKEKSRLYYFMNPSDSLVGVKDDNGRIIIPPTYPGFINFAGDTVSDWDALIVMKDIKMKSRSNSTAHSHNDAYSREGKLLFHPMDFDGIPDEPSEGLIRCVRDGRIGYADLVGNIVIEPQWEWASEFYYGYAFVCNHCYFDRTKDPEHPMLAFEDNADTFYINREGKRVEPLQQAGHPKDQPVNGKYLPYPFRYTAAEQKLLDRFDSTTLLSKIAYVNYYPLRTGKGARLHFEIVQRPVPAYPYYLVQGYDWNEGYRINRQMLFGVDEQGRWFSRDAVFGPLPYDEWLHNSLESCREFLETHPDVPNRFAVKDYLQKREAHPHTRNRR